jgi:hypothetical protein
MMTTPDLTEQIACVQRELALRKPVYPKRVAAGKMKPQTADRETAAMQAVLDTLTALETRAAAAGRCGAR